jgi:hypothetical protein
MAVTNNHFSFIRLSVNEPAAGQKAHSYWQLFPPVAFWQRQPERKNSGTIRRTLVENRPM